MNCPRGFAWNTSGCYVCKFHNFQLGKCLHPAQFGQMPSFADSNKKAKAADEKGNEAFEKARYQSAG